MTAALTSAPSPIRQFALFCAIGLVNTAVGYAAILFASFVLGFSLYAANAFGYGVGLLISFTLNRRVTFGSRTAALPGLARFALAFVPCYGLNLLVLHLAVHSLALPEYLAQAAAITTYTIAFFALCRFFVFRRDGEPQPTDGESR